MHRLERQLEQELGLSEVTAKMIDKHAETAPCPDWLNVSGLPTFKKKIPFPESGNRDSFFSEHSIFY